MSDRFEEMPNNPMIRDRFVPKRYEIIGKRGRKRIDGLRKAGGSAVYTRDIVLPGMLYARWLKSPYPNARIERMDTTAAEKLPGVRAILRFDDPEVKDKRIPALQGGEEDVLTGFAYFQGQPLGAVVAADTEEIAKEALARIDIQWQQRPFVLEAKEALKEGASLARPERMPDGNKMGLFFQPSDVFSFGDIRQGFQEAEQIIEFEAKRTYHGCADAEPVNGITRWSEDCVELWVHSQHPYEHKWMMNLWFGIPMTKVKINSPYNGAMFGGWNWIDYSLIPQYTSALLARRTGRPVKWVFNRRDDFIFGSLDAMESTFKVGFKKDGTITAVQMKSYFINLSFEPALHFIENTCIPHVESETLVAQVNKGPTHAIRCEQMPPAFSLIHVFNHVAAALKMDPTALALINDGEDGKRMEELKTVKSQKGFPVRDSLKECIEAGKKAIDWDAKWHAPGTLRLPNGNMHGIGFIWDHEWDDNRGAGEAGLLIQQDGTVSIIALRADVGVNAETAYCQIVAEELGMRFEDVFLRQNDDVHLPLMTPDGSCNLTTNGYVMKKLAKKAKLKLLELATSTVHRIEMEVPPAFPGRTVEELEVKDSVIYVKDNPTISKTVAEVVKDVQGSLGSYLKKHEYAAIQNTTHDPVYVWAYHRQGRLGKEPGRHRFCRQVHFCEIEVDLETGEIEVIKVVNVNDVGKAISPEGVEGQQYGGTYMGVGRNRSEEYIWDPVTGVLLNGNLIDYKFSTMKDVGPIETIIVETGMGLGPYGSVGVGEDVATETAYLLHGAVYNAIGRWVDDGPITPDKVLKALGKV